MGADTQEESFHLLKLTFRSWNRQEIESWKIHMLEKRQTLHKKGATRSWLNFYDATGYLFKISNNREK